MAILTVGTGEQFSTLASALAASKDGDTINVDAGTYTNDFSYVSTKVTIQGVGGMVNLVATVPPPNGKAILCVTTDVTMNNISFSGCKVADLNGAGIRQEGGNLVLNNCDFHDNQEGILAPGVNDGTGSLTITNSTFSNNGAGDGYSHNIYVGNLANFTITNSLIQGAVVGHEIKSRAQVSVIENNRIIDGPTAPTSYSIDLPNGGQATVSGNIIEKGPNAENDNIIHFGGEGIPYANSSLVISGNTLTNDKAPGQANFVLNQTLTPVTITNNQLNGAPLGQLAIGLAVQSSNTANGVAVPDAVHNTPALGAHTSIFTDNDPHTLSVGAGDAVQGGGGLLTLTGLAHDTVQGGSGGLIWQGEGGGDTITTQAGSVNTLNLGAAGSNVQSAGTDVIVSGGGNDLIEADGNATITGSAGASTFTLNGNDQLASNGSDSIVIGGHANATVTSSSFVNVLSNGGTMAITRTDGAEVDTAVLSGAYGIKSWAGSGLNVTTAGQDLLTFSTGNNLVRSVGADTIQAGSGADTVIVSSSAQVRAGTGNLSVFGRSESSVATVWGAAGGNVDIDGDTGGIDYVGAAGASTLQANLGQITINGGAGELTITGRAGRLSIVGGSGGITLNSTAGADVITTAAQSTNALSFMDSSIVTSAGTDTITLGSVGNTITVLGNATVNGAAAAGNRYQVNGSASLTTGGNGSNWVNIAAGGSARVTDASSNLWITSAGQLQLHATGGGDNDTATVSGQATVSSQAYVGLNISTAQNGAASLTLSSGNAQISSFGADTISTSGGTQNVTATGNASITAGAGTMTLNTYGSASVQGGAGNVTVSSWNGSLTFLGGSGNANISGATGEIDVTAGSGNITLAGGSGTRNFVAGTGAAVVTGGCHTDTFRMGSGQTTVNSLWGQENIDFVNGHGGGVDVINSFKVGTDKLAFVGFGSGGAIAAQSATSGGLQLQLTDGTKVTLTGISALTANMLA